MKEALHKSACCMIPLIPSSRTEKNLIRGTKKSEQWLWLGLLGECQKRLEGTFWDNETLLHLDKGLGSKDACVC